MISIIRATKTKIKNNIHNHNNFVCRYCLAYFFLFICIYYSVPTTSLIWFLLQNMKYYCRRKISLFFLCINFSEFSFLFFYVCFISSLLLHDGITFFISTNYSSVYSFTCCSFTSHTHTHILFIRYIERWRPACLSSSLHVKQAAFNFFFTCIFRIY